MTAKDRKALIAARPRLSLTRDEAHILIDGEARPPMVGKQTTLRGIRRVLVIAAVYVSSAVALGVVVGVARFLFGEFS